MICSDENDYQIKFKIDQKIFIKLMALICKNVLFSGLTVNKVIANFIYQLKDCESTKNKEKERLK
jgi:cyclophilin family peptidyl-prolyl cis-trans isomerase